MTIQSPVRTIGTLATTALVGMLILGGGASSASAAGTDLSASALEQFRANLTSSSDIAKFDVLTAAQQANLADYLLGKIDPVASMSNTKTHSGNFEVRTSTTASSTNLSATATTTALVAATGTRTVSAWQSFLFAGITISKTTVSETYYYSGTSATSIASYSCVVNANYDPFSSVTSAKSGKYVSAGKATAECLVTVKRGVPTPWGPIAWSTVQAIQYVTGNGSGYVTSHGWR